VLQIVGRDGQEVLGGQLGVVSFPGQDRAQLLPARHSIDRRRATLGAVRLFDIRRLFHADLESD
jgi:hypothetical protein